MSVNDPMMESKHHDPMLDCITCRDWDGFPAADGEVVEFSDLSALLAAVREDERRTLTGGERHREWWVAFGMGKVQGQRDEREACIAAVAALPCDSYEITVSRQTVLDALRAREEKS